MTLKQALEGLTERKFCTGSFAKDACGFTLSPYDPNAFMFCVDGWFRATFVPANTVSLAEEAANSLGYRYLSVANDSMGYAFVEALRNYQEDSK